MSLSFAIIGCGNIAKRHAEQIQIVGKLVAVCDIIRSKAEELGKKYNVDVFSSIEELFVHKKKVDVAVICTPNGLHAAHSIISLQSHAWCRSYRRVLRACSALPCAGSVKISCDEVGQVAITIV